MSTAKRVTPISEDPQEKRRRIVFDLATTDDDWALRHLLQSIWMDGVIRVSFRREPNYFAAHDCEGDFVQVITARDTRTDQIVGMGSRSVRERYFDGRSKNIGYLSGLRIHPEYRHGTMLARGYQFLKQLDQDGRAEFYVTTIAVENKPATESLLGGRAGLPFYMKMGRLNTWIVPKTTKKTERNSKVLIRPINDMDMPQLMSFLTRVSQTRTLLPCYKQQDFEFPSTVFAGMQKGELLGMWIDSELVGTLGVWDQRAIKQVVVEAYDWWLSWVRPIYNVWAGLSGRVRFPKPGECLPLVTGALPLAIGNGVGAFGDLVDQAASCLPEDADAIMIGLSEGDPMNEAVRDRAIQKYQTDIFAVSWDLDCVETALQSKGVPYLELGTL